MTRRHLIRAERLGVRITEAREALGWSQADLASAVGTTQQAISLLEGKGKALPPGCNSRRAVVLARALKVSPQWLAFGIEGYDPEVPWTWEGYGARLAAARGERTQQEIGEALHYGKKGARKALQAIEAERTNLDLALAEKVSWVLEIDVCDLAFSQAQAQTPK